MSWLSDLILFTKLSVLDLLNRQKLKRIPEPDSITTDPAAVEDYNQVHNSSLVLPYALSLQILQILLKNKQNIRLLDLACGPGLFSKWMAQNLSIQSLIGMDLSNPMLDRARERFVKNESHLTSIKFIQNDVTDLSSIPSASLDLVTFMNAAHHIPNLELVKKTLSEASRVCKNDGFIFLADHTRPRTEKILKIYYHWISKKNKKLGLSAHNLDFYHSLYAGWDTQEFSLIIPAGTNHKWIEIYPLGFQYIRFIIGVPLDFGKISFADLKVEKSLDFIPVEFHPLWKLLLIQFKLGARTKSHSV